MWIDRDFERTAKAFLARLRDAEGRPIAAPSLVAEKTKGLTGLLPGEHQFDAMQLAIHFGVLDANPSWKPDADGWWVATSDNSEIWAQPIDVKSGRIALSRGSVVPITSGGWRVDDEKLEIRSVLELHIPLDGRFVPDVADAIYAVANGKHDATDATLARRIATSVRWLAKAWRNTTSLGHEDRVVMLRTAFEALTGTSESARAIAVLDNTFAALKDHGATADNTDHLLWNPSESAHRPFAYLTKGGKTKTEKLSDLGHWFSSFGEARHQIVHEGVVPVLEYREPDSRYAGPLFYVGERLLREAIRASLVTFGYDDLWEAPFGRGLTKKITEMLSKSEPDQPNA